MSMAVPTTEDTQMNMTPMIDVVFQLVTFFLLTLDMAQKEFVEVDLPIAYRGATEDPSAVQEIPRLVINLIADGKVQFKGVTYDLSASDPQGQDRAIEDLKEFLISLTANPKWREPNGASKVSVMVHGDRAARWQYTQWIMQVCSHSSIRIYKVQFAVKHPVVEGA